MNNHDQSIQSCLFDRFSSATLSFGPIELFPSHVTVLQDIIVADASDLFQIDLINEETAAHHEVPDSGLLTPISYLDLPVRPFPYYFLSCT